jgi:hypothetical protein
MDANDRKRLHEAVLKGILSADQAGQLLEFLARDRPPADGQPRFSLVHVLYYLGGMIAIGAMSLFMTLGWRSLGGWGGFGTAICYLVLFLALTRWFIERKRLAIPAGIMATLAVVMVPLAIFSAQAALGYWDGAKAYRDYHVFIDGRWLMMELGTLAIGAVLGRRVFAVFGGLGVAGYLGHLSWRVFRESLVFPFALTLIGLAIIWLGVVWQRREREWSERLRALLPAALRELIEARAVR